jgi:hypothetical protein
VEELAGETLAPWWVMVGTRLVASVPYGTVKTTVLAPMVPAMPEIEKAVMSLAGLPTTITVTV